ncbi:unnamed protein product [Prunus armeniaca]|uniref:RNase H type-1 domain-containing protein n=1 Tax=Prunus armeniaca TaxID=36596 RepID=A0A6J5Y7R9_PRUAR|nr:unnamed protein product [Prunus armeniaca]
MDKCSISTLDVWLCSMFSTIGMEQNDVDRIKIIICFFLLAHMEGEVQGSNGQRSPSHRDTIQRSSNKLMSSFPPWNAPSNRSPRPQNLVHNTTWLRPLSRLVKLNMDAAWDPISKSVSIGMVVRDHNGQFLAGKSLLAQADLALWLNAYVPRKV